MQPYTPRTRIGGFILTCAINGVLHNRKGYADMLRILRRDEGTPRARQCNLWIIWIGSYPIKH
jgi:hypothetical protein